jgi:hypothetical protein
MPSSKLSPHTIRRSGRLLALFAALGAIEAIAGCGGGDPCLRHTDCGSGFVCVEGKCFVDVGDNPADSAPVSDATVSGDASVSDTSGGGNRDVTSEDDAEQDSDATGPDAQRDVGNATDAVVSRDVLDASNSDATDARASADSGTDAGGNVGADADSSISRDADATSDATDAAG